MIKLLKKFEYLLTELMSILILIAFNISIMAGKIITDLLDINKTMGWKISVLRTWIDSIPYTSFLLFFVVYLILNILKIKTNLILSAIHFGLITLGSFIYNFWELDMRIILSFFICSFVIFGMNLYNTLKRK